MLINREEITIKALYKHKRRGDLFAIETGEDGGVVSTSGPLLCGDIDPDQLDYDNYWNEKISANVRDFVLLSKLEYLEILHKNGFYSQITQQNLF